MLYYEGKREEPHHGACPIYLRHDDGKLFQHQPENEKKMLNNHPILPLEY